MRTAIANLRLKRHHVVPTESPTVSLTLHKNDDLGPSETANAQYTVDLILTASSLDTFALFKRYFLRTLRPRGL